MFPAHDINRLLTILTYINVCTQHAQAGIQAPTREAFSPAQAPVSTDLKAATRVTLCAHALAHMPRAGQQGTHPGRQQTGYRSGSLSRHVPICQAERAQLLWYRAQLTAKMSTEAML